MNAFWRRVARCKHKRADSTMNIISCWTPYCQASEDYCPDCRAYIVSCQCGFCNGISGWSEARHRRQRRKQARKQTATINR